MSLPDPASLLDPGPPVLLPHEMFWSTSKVSPLELKPQLLDGIFTSVPAASGLVTASCQFSITDHLRTAAVTAASPVEAGLEREAHTAQAREAGRCLFFSWLHVLLVVHGRRWVLQA